MVYNFDKNSCLLIIDIQEDNKNVYNFKQLRSNIIKLIEYARQNKILICYIFFINNKKSYWKKFKKELTGKITDEGNPLEFIIPEKNEKIIFKNAYDSFFESELDKILKKNNIKNIYISGVLTGVCVLNTIFTGFNLGYRIIVFENCCSDKNKKRHQSVFENYSNYLFIKDKI